MVSRQIRLTTQPEISSKLRDFIGKKINIVLSNRTVLFGELRTISDSQLTFLNMRLEPCSLPLTEVNEVYLDLKE